MISRVAFQTANNGNTGTAQVDIDCTGADMLVVGAFESAGAGTATNISSLVYNTVETVSFLGDEYRTFSSGQVVSLWALPAPSAGNHTVLATLGASDDVTLFAWALASADQTLPTGAAIAKFSSNTAPDAVMNPTSIADGSWALSVIRNLDGGISNGTNYFSLTGNVSVDAGDSNGSTGSAGSVTVDAPGPSAPGDSRWGGCITALFAPGPPAKRRSVGGGATYYGAIAQY